MNKLNFQKSFQQKKKERKKTHSYRESFPQMTKIIFIRAQNAMNHLSRQHILLFRLTVIVLVYFLVITTISSTQACSNI